MTLGIRFTAHARVKFELLAKYGFVVIEAEVIEALRFADQDMEHRAERIAASDNAIIASF